MNVPIIFATALIPLFVGMIWYNEKVFGKKWMSLNGFTADSLKQGNMLVIFGLTYVFSVFFSFMLSGLVIHQQGIYQLFASQEGFGTTGAASTVAFDAFMAEFGQVHRSAGHGALHGAMAGVLFIFPIIAINGLFERKPWSYILIHSGYWVVSATIMGAILCQFM